MNLTPSRPARIALVLLSSSLCTIPVLAQTQEAAPAPVPAAPLQDQWQKVQDASSHITACHVVWKRVMRIAPLTAAEANPDKWADSAFKQARKRGESEAKARQLAQSMRQEALLAQKSTVINSTLDFVRVGRSVLCRLTYTDPAYSGMRTLEFSDGRTSLEATTYMNGKPVAHMKGSVTNDPQEMLKMSASGFQMARFLLGLPLDQSFGPRVPALSAQNAALKLQPDGTLLAERDVRFENRKSVDPDEIAFAKDTFCPLSATTFGLMASVVNGKVFFKKYKPHSHIVASDYKQYANGVWFPSKIVTTSSSRTINEYTLVEAHFNEEVDPSLLRLPEMYVYDNRLGTGINGSYYTLKKGVLPSDEELPNLDPAEKQINKPGPV